MLVFREMVYVCLHSLAVSARKASAKWNSELIVQDQFPDVRGGRDFFFTKIKEGVKKNGELIFKREPHIFYSKTYWN